MAIPPEYNYESDDYRDNNQRSFKPDKDGNVARNVCDVAAIEQLEAISTALGGTVNVTRTVYNVSLGPINTEQSQALPAGTKGFIIRTRGKSELKLAFSVGTSGTNFVTVPKNSNYSDDFMSTALTLYFQSPQSGDVVEIVAYS